MLAPHGTPARYANALMLKPWLVYRKVYMAEAASTLLKGADTTAPKLESVQMIPPAPPKMESVCLSVWANWYSIVA